MNSENMSHQQQSQGNLTNDNQNQQGKSVSTVPNHFVPVNSSMEPQLIPYELAYNLALNPAMLSYANLRYRSKKDTLRKGKWTPEEELFTNKIIEAFNAGLLKLPENSSGITLRSYLAEKLGCDPMRITKKYTGASCLGKRVYHKEMSSSSADEVNRVHKELEVLEGKFLEKLEQVRLERREHESAIEGLYNHPISISTPNIDAMVLHNGSVPIHYNNGHFTLQAPYNHLPQQYMNAAMSMGYSTDMGASFNNESGSTTTNCQGQHEDGNGNKLNGPMISNLTNGSQLAYMQMMANVGPYQSQYNMYNQYQNSNGGHHQSSSRSSSSNSTSLRNPSNEGNGSAAGSNRSEDGTTDEDKNDSSSNDDHPNKNQKKEKYSVTKSDSDSSSSNGNMEEELYMSQRNNRSYEAKSPMTSQASSTSGNDDDKAVASSLLGLFNHIKRSSSHQDLLEFVEDAQKKSSATPTNNSKPEATRPSAVGSNGGSNAVKRSSIYTENGHHNKKQRKVAGESAV